MPRLRSRTTVRSACARLAPRRARLVALVAAAALLASSAAPATPRAGEFDPRDTSRLRVGVGDRLGVARGDRFVETLDLLDHQQLPVDFVQLWLPRGWQKSWVRRDALARLHERGIVPVVVHYFFGDGISQQRVESQRAAWYSSLWEMSQQLRGDSPVLVILEPEWNDAPPHGETAITDWPWFANDLRAAAMLIRREAPNVLVGTCPGDFAGRPGLETVLGPVADDLDFLAFQEMRAGTDRDSAHAGYTEVGRAAVDYARYLKRAFDRPLLLGYVALSSHGGWESRQREMLRDLFARERELRDAGVFGLIYFQLYDDPHHRGYFGAAERHFGLLTADGKPKPALDVFRAALPRPARGARGAAR